MTITAHVHQVYIAGSPEQVWRAITDSDWTQRYFFGTVFVRPLEAGQPYRTITPDGADATAGTVETLEPPTEGRPGRLVLTWRTLYDAALAAAPPSRVEWTVESAGEGLTRVRLVHGDLAASPLTWASVRTGWPWVLDGLKTVLETGRSLPPRRREATADASPDSGSVPAGSEAPGVEAAGVDGVWHRSQAVTAHQETWALLDRSDRTQADDAELVAAAFTSAYHWTRATGRTPANAARADYLIAKAQLATGRPTDALVWADSCLQRCRSHDLADFDLAYGFEIRARALWDLGRTGEAESDWAAALAVPVADPEDREWFERDVRDGLAPTAAVGPASR